MKNAKNKSQLHIIADFYDCSKKPLKKKESIETIFKNILKNAKLNVIHSKFYQFNPFGVTGFLLLKESHISIHTWPENNSAAIDIFTCGNRKNARLAYKILVEKLKPKRIEKKEINRFDKISWFEDIYDKEKSLIQIKKKIFEKQTKFQKIQIFDTYKYKKIFAIDGEIQSAQTDEFIYHESLVHPALLIHPNPANILIIGAGEGASGREILKHNTIKKITGIDIDKELITIVKKYLKEWHQGAFDNKKYKLIIEDGRKFLEKTNEKFDIIICDLTDPVYNSPVRYLYTKEFYKLVKKALNKNGIFVTQAQTIDPNKLKLHCSISKTLKSVFKNVKSYNVHVESFKALWGFLIASDNNINIDIDVDDILKKRNVKNLKHYNQETHNRMFLFPKYFKTKYKKNGRILTDKKPYSGGF